MIDALKDFFKLKAQGGPDLSTEAHERAVWLAAGVLLFEIVRADRRVEDAERTVMRTALQSTFNLTADQTDEIMGLSETRSRTASSLFEFTSVIDAEFSGDQKKRIVELLWLVAFADGRKDAEEEHLIRKIAGLLHVAHPDFIDAKIRARSQG
ncbi:MAG TPA: TerB family tellurite resistance protein [Vicinamibacteria bacterium]|nr:TerB family tellurite resistance protein [Vicinamibacteria bacterium]HRB12462.1 TerB family tellurite resistance protein [Vicinamibacteria bacterium]